MYIKIHCKARFYDVAMFTFCPTFLLWSVETRNTVISPITHKCMFEMFIKKFHTTITLKNFNL